MSAILILNVSDKTYPNTGRHFIAELESGKHSVIVAVGPNGIRVIVQNASNRAWRGLGKLFASLDVALAAYKTATIRAMIVHAVELSQATPAGGTARRPPNGASMC